MDEVVGRGRRGDDVPDAESRAAAELEQQRLPLSYFAGTLAAPRGWDKRPGAYLAFGDTYTAERKAALQRGWPVRTLPTGHLRQLHEPDLVAETQIDLLGQILPRPSSMTP